MRKKREREIYKEQKDCGKKKERDEYCKKNEEKKFIAKTTDY